MVSAPLIGVLVFGAIATVVLIVAAIRSGRSELPVDAARLREVQAEWRAPGELASQSRPRNVSYSTGARAVFVLFAVLAAGVIVGGAFLVPAALREQQDRDLVQREGVPGTGTITRRWSVRGKSTSYHVSYAYDVDGRPYAKAAEVSRGTYDRLAVGMATPVHYLPSRPDLGLMDDASQVPAWLKLLIFLPFLFLLAIPWSLSQRRRLLAWGTPVGAIVTRSVPTKGGRAIRYRFLDASGTAATGQDTVPPREAPEPGDIITILIDRDRPRRTGRYPVAMVELIE